MTDFDYEILEAVAKYDAGISQDELEVRHFSGYSLTYELLNLSKAEPSEPGAARVVNANSACLYTDKTALKSSGGTTIFTVRYSITNRGKSLLANWQRRRAEAAARNKERVHWQRIEAIIIGVSTGIIATCICSKFLGL